MITIQVCWQKRNVKRALPRPKQDCRLDHLHGEVTDLPTQGCQVSSSPTALCICSMSSWEVSQESSFLTFCVISLSLSLFPFPNLSPFFFWIRVRGWEGTFQPLPVPLDAYWFGFVCMWGSSCRYVIACLLVLGVKESCLAVSFWPEISVLNQKESFSIRLTTDTWLIKLHHVHFSSDWMNGMVWSHFITSLLHLFCRQGIAWRPDVLPADADSSAARTAAWHHCPALHHHSQHPHFSATPHHASCSARWDVRWVVTGELMGCSTFCGRPPQLAVLDCETGHTCADGQCV